MQKTPPADSTRKKGLTRREFTKSAAAVAAGTGLGLFGGVAPAFAQKREVHHVAWNNFIPPADDVTREHAKAFEQETGVAIRFETINQNDLQAKAAAAIEGGAGPDILQLHWNTPTSTPEASSTTARSSISTGVTRSTPTRRRRSSSTACPAVSRSTALATSWPTGRTCTGTSGSRYRTRGTSFWPSARSASRRAGRSDRPSATPSATRRSSPIR